METKDTDLAKRVAEFVSRFPDEWHTHQSWLRAIMVSRPMLLERYPRWQARLIFRWRLVYFVVYVTSGILLGRGVQKIANGVVAATAQYRLQRLATLLAVVELTLCGIAALTGVMLAFYYQPTALGAHASLKMIVDRIANGALVLSLHDVAGNGLIFLSLVQIIVMFLGREFLLSWFIAWVSGISLTLTAMALSWTAIVLAWEQTGFWRFKIELTILGSLPVIGPGLRDILSGGSGISSFTLQHMYMVHSYVLAIAAILISIAHLTALVLHEHRRPSDTSLCVELTDSNA